MKRIQFFSENRAPLGTNANKDEVFTCAMATARFLATQKQGGTAYVIGEHGYPAVDDDADFVVVREGRTLTFEMIERATVVLAFSVGETQPHHDARRTQGDEPAHRRDRNGRRHHGDR